MARSKRGFKIASTNSVVGGKGLGFSASAFAALGKAACRALDFELDAISLSELVRVGAGSATRSLAGAFALWYANRNGRSYAVQIAGAESVDLGMVVVPLPSAVRTDEAHLEVLSSPLFEARLAHVKGLLGKMARALKNNDVETIGRMAEEDTLNLHASTMTGKAHMILWEPETLRIVKSVQQMRAGGVPTWFSMDTGPSVFVNANKKHIREVAERLRRLGCCHVIESNVGGEPFFTDDHLF
jgi:diphosphomevalonate decarboxylase